MNSETSLEALRQQVLEGLKQGKPMFGYHGERGVIEWVLADYRIKHKILPEVNYHYVDWEYKGIECEIHFKPTWMNCPWHNMRLQKWCKENVQWNIGEYEGFNIPSVEFNATYQLVHIYRHLFNEGVGLRQLLDYYFVLKVLKSYSNLSRAVITQNFASLGILPFASAVMCVLARVFDSRNENEDWQTKWPWMLCAPDAKRGEFLLNEILLAGNFGKNDSRNVIGAREGYIKRFFRRQKRFLRFLTQYPSEVIWGPYFSVKQRLWRIWHGWR